MKDLVVFIHIPKTAGTTFNYIVKKNYSWFYKFRNLNLDNVRHYLSGKKNVAVNLPGGYGDSVKAIRLIKCLSDSEFSRINFIGGHIGYVGPNLNGRKIRYITFVRPPMERLVSDFKEHHKPGRYFYKELKKSDFDFKHYLELIKQNRLDNIMTRHFLGPYDFFENQNPELNHHQLNKAIENAEEMLIGDVGDFDNSIYYFSKKLSWQRLKYNRLNASLVPNEIKNDYLNNTKDLIQYDLLLYETLRKTCKENFSILDKIIMPVKFLS